jgi:hypothetical protein
MFVNFGLNGFLNLVSKKANKKLFIKPYFFWDSSKDSYKNFWRTILLLLSARLFSLITCFFLKQIQPTFQV